MGQNAFLYESAEGLLTSVIMLIAEFCPAEKRHIISVFKMIQDLLALFGTKGKSQFQILVDKLGTTRQGGSREPLSILRNRL